MAKCRSGDGCDRDAVNRDGGGEGKWCAEHAEQLTRVAASMGTLTRAAIESLRGQWALKISSAVWNGRTGNLQEVIGTPPTADFRAAVKVAERNGWIFKRPNAKKWERGPNQPPGYVEVTQESDEADPADPEPDSIGRIPIPVRIERLRALIEERGEMSKVEAASEIGLSSSKGSFPRILRRATQLGLVIPGNHVVKPGPNITQPQEPQGRSQAAPAPV